MPRSGLEDIKVVDLLCNKLSSYPYSLHNYGLAFMKNMKQPPAKEYFANSLRDYENISERAYDDFVSLWHQLKIKDALSLSLLYLSIDLFSLSIVLNISSKIMMRHFGLNIFCYSSISRFAFDILLQDATNILGQDHGLQDIESPLCWMQGRSRFLEDS